MLVVDILFYTHHGILTKLACCNIMEKILFALAEQLGAVLLKKRLKIATAESCTGGLIAQSITEVPGSSAWFDRGFVTYSNAAKIQMLGVQQKTLALDGAVSEAIVCEMVIGALQNSDADCAIAVSGIAGPTGGTAEKPVGTVCLAWGEQHKQTLAWTESFVGDRQTIRKLATIKGLRKAIENIG
jgi:nicotinamide-nucleotide amidase